MKFPPRRKHSKLHKFWISAGWDVLQPVAAQAEGLQLQQLGGHLLVAAASKVEHWRLQQTEQRPGSEPGQPSWLCAGRSAVAARIPAPELIAAPFCPGAGGAGSRHPEPAAVTSGRCRAEAATAAPPAGPAAPRCTPPADSWALANALSRTI